VLSRRFGAESHLGLITPEILLFAYPFDSIDIDGLQSLEAIARFVFSKSTEIEIAGRQFRTRRILHAFQQAGKKFRSTKEGS
jgi:hypothetical protein